MKAIDIYHLCLSNGISISIVENNLKILARNGVVSEGMKELIRENKNDLIELLKKRSEEAEKAKGSVHGNQTPLVAFEREDKIPLSYAQQSMWLLTQMEGGDSAHYNMPLALRIRGGLNLKVLVETLQAIVLRHEVLRTRFVEISGSPNQVIDDGSKFEVIEETISESNLQTICDNEAAKLFDLEAEGPIRARVCFLKESGDTLLLVTMHHIASDAWSLEVFFREIKSIYYAIQVGTPSSLPPPLTIQYADFALWQRKALNVDILQSQIEYWRTQLSGIPPLLMLPTDRQRPAMKTNNGAHEALSISSELKSKLYKLSERANATVYMTLLSAFSILLSRYSSQQDITIGTPVANRSLPEVENLIGFFVNTLVLRMNLSDDSTFNEYLARVKETVLGAHEHQDLPFEKLVEILQPKRDLSFTPLFQVTFDFHQESQDEKTISENIAEGTIEVSPIIFDFKLAKYDLSIDLYGNEKGLFGYVEYNTDLFNRKTIRNFIKHYECLLHDIVENPASPISQLNILSDQDRREQLLEWNDTYVDYPEETCIHELFESQVEQYPTDIAVVFEGEQISYQVLNQRANQVAHYLISHGIQPDSIVGLCVERSPEMVVGILGIMKAGGAYVPIDPSYPEARIKYILDDTGTDIILTQRHLKDRLSVKQKQQLIYLDTDSDAKGTTNIFSSQPKGNLLKEVVQLTSRHLAYVIYTSGSTGKPKGVMIEHRSLTNRINWMGRQYGCSRKDRILQKTPFSFDVSVWEFMWPLSVGARLVLAKPEKHKDHLYLLELIKKEEITKLHFVPSMLESLLALKKLSECRSLQQVFCSGEALQLHQVEAFITSCSRVELHNLYGPTEAAIDVSYWNCTNFDSKMASIPIGRPIQNMQLLVLDKHLGLAPQRVTGELYIGGIGLARGYLHNIKLTDEKFISNPFGTEPNARLYKTGDLVRWLPGGELEFIGRCDDQVKIRGFRIELGEIESHLLQHAWVDSCVVLARGDGHEGKSLVAYVVLSPEIDNDVEGCATVLRAHLQEQLPEYMVPSAFMVLEALPLTSNGKVDRQSLPAPNSDAYAQEKYIKPKTETELALIKIWAELLKFEPEKISTSANFFALGGHSMLMIKMIAQLQEMGFGVNVKSVLSNKTLSDLAADIEIAKNDGADIFEAPIYFVPESCGQITPEMLPLIKLSQEELDMVVKRVPGGIENIQDIYPLMPLQEGILFHHLMDQSCDPYILLSLFKVDSQQVLDAMLNSLQTIVNRHDVLRTSIMSDKISVPVQVVHRRAELNISYFELNSKIDSQIQLDKLIDGPHEMDLSLAPLLKITVAQKPNSEQKFVLFALHHIISDHIGAEVISHEIITLLSGKALADPLPYRDFLAHALHCSTNRDPKPYFREKLGDLTEATLTFNLQNFHSDRLKIEEADKIISSELSNKIRQTAREMNILPASLFHAAWSLVVSACSGKDDVVFGTVLSGRLQGAKGSEKLLGMFINTLPLRVSLKEKNVHELIFAIETDLAELLTYEHTPLTLAQGCTGIESGEILFNSMLNYRHSEAVVESDIDSETPEYISFVKGRERTNYPLTASVDDLGKEFVLTVQIDRSVSATRVVEYFETAIAVLVNALKENPEQSALNISVLPESERYIQTAKGSQSPVNFSDHKCLHERFEEQVEYFPDRPAVKFMDETINYVNLNKRANRLAHYLLDQGVKPETIVGLCVDRSVDMVIGVLGILKAGGAYLPLDPSYPKARLEVMLSDSDTQIILTQLALRSVLPENLGKRKIVYLDEKDFKEELIGRSDANPCAQFLGLTSNNLAYLIYTSGSTGQPKGALIEHYNVTRLIDACAEHFTFTECDVWTLFHSYAFDFSVWEIWGALSKGGCLVVVPGSVTRSVNDFYELLVHHKVTVLNQTPSAFNPLIEVDKMHNSNLKLRYVIFGGEALRLGALKPWINRHGDELPQLVNMYGITETTVHVTYHRLYADEIRNKQNRSLIGVPLQDLKVLLLDRHQRVVPFGVSGEMYVAGAGVARGYLGQEVLTESRFVKLAEFSGRWYKTGDVARYIDSGELEYLGRLDDQVKLRGFRIELGEIESQLSKIKGVKDCAVVLRGGEFDDKSLVAYVVNDQTVEADFLRNDYLNTIRAELQQHLPDYMIPPAFVMIDDFPLTPNGKVDLKGLPAPEDDAYVREKYQAPNTEMEVFLTDIWQNILDLDRIGVHDNFFMLGGQSLIAIRVLSEIGKGQSIGIDLRDLFKYPTVYELAKYMEDLEEKSLEFLPLKKKPFSRKVRISYAQQMYWSILQNKSLSNELQIIYPLNIHGQLNYFALKKSLQCIVDRHESLQLTFFEKKEQVWLRTNKQLQINIPIIELNKKYLNNSVNHQEVIKKEVEVLLNEFLSKNFDLVNGPLVRALLIKISSEEHVFLFNMHHIVGDESSISIIKSELSTLYDAYAGGKPVDLKLLNLPNLEIQYSDYAYWERESHKSKRYQKQLAYWKNKLSGLMGLEAQVDILDTSSEKKSLLRQKQIIIPEDILEKISIYCREKGITLYIFYMALLHLCYFYHTGATRIVVLSPLTARKLPELRNLVGLFLNTLPVGSIVNETDTLSEYIAQIKSTVLEAHINLDIQFSAVGDEMGMDKSSSNIILFNYVNIADEPRWQLGDLEVDPFEISRDNRPAMQALELNMIRTDKIVIARFHYDAEKYKGESIEKISSNFTKLIDLVLKGAENTTIDKIL